LPRQSASRPAQRRWRKAGAAAIAAAALLLAEPVLATSCDEEAIAAMSLDEAAEMIWERSDVIGFGYVSTIDTPERVQQFIDMVVSFKGGTDRRHAFAPLRVGRIGHPRGVYRLTARPDEVVFVTLFRIEEGYIIPACHHQLLAKDRTGIIRRLAALSQRRPWRDGPAAPRQLSAPPRR
jgi:hypothetical protein